MGPTLTSKPEKIARILSKKSGLITPFKVVLDPKKRGFAHVSAKYSKGTGEIKGITMKINPRHIEILSRKAPKKTETYLRYSIAHEIGHIKQIEEWGIRKTRKMPRFMQESDADKRAYSLIGLSEKKVKKTLRELQKLF